MKRLMSWKADNKAWEYIRYLEKQLKESMDKWNEAIKLNDEAGLLMDKFEKESNTLREFADYILQTYSWGKDIDGGDAQDKAEALGLIELRPCNPDDYEGAKEVYFTKWTPKETK